MTHCHFLLSLQSIVGKNQANTFYTDPAANVCLSVCSKQQLRREAETHLSKKSRMESSENATKTEVPCKMRAGKTANRNKSIISVEPPLPFPVESTLALKLGKSSNHFYPSLAFCLCWFFRLKAPQRWQPVLAAPGSVLPGWRRTACTLLSGKHCNTVHK